MRPDESATVRIQPESAANAHILMMGVGWLIRLVLPNIAWVGVRLVSKYDYTPRDNRAIAAIVSTGRGEHAELARLSNCPSRSWSRVGEERRLTTMAGKKRKAKSTVRNRMPKGGAPEGSTLYRSATTGRYVTRSADRDPSVRARTIRERFRVAGRRLSDSSEIVREDRDAD